MSCKGMAEPPATPLGTGRGRQIAVFSILLIFASILFGRLYYWQVTRHDWLATKAQNEHFHDELIPAQRGAIYDVNGSVLATNEAVDSVYASLSQIEDKAKAAAVLSPLIN